MRLILYMLWNTSWHYDICLYHDVIWRHEVHILTYFVYFWSLWHTFWCYDVIFDVMTYLLTLWRSCSRQDVLSIIFMLCCISWHNDVLSILLCHNILFDIITYSLTLWNNLLLYVMMNFPYILTYFLRLWNTFRCHDIHLDVRTQWRHGVFLMLWHTFWRYDVLLSWRTFW